MPYPKLAGDRDAAFLATEQWIIGEAEIVTESAPALADITARQLCVLLTTGITPFVPGTHTTAFPNKLVISQVAVLSGKQCPYYQSGKFNHELITWPAGAAYDTLAERKELLLGSELKVGHLI